MLNKNTAHTKNNTEFTQINTVISTATHTALKNTAQRLTQEKGRKVSMNEIVVEAINEFLKEL